MSTNGKDSSTLANVRGIKQHGKDWGYEKKGMATLSLGRMEMKGLLSKGRRDLLGRDRREQERTGLDIDGTGGIGGVKKIQKKFWHLIFFLKGH